MSYRRFPLLPSLALSVALAAVAPAGGGVLTVSPGAPDRPVEVASPCPSFSWSAAEGASAYELAVLDVTDAESPALVYSQRIDGAALSWTPSRDGCLASGRDYAWVVRAERPGAEVGDWSAARFFRVPGTPSPAELEAALAVLERWRAGQAGALGEPGGAGAPTAPTAESRERGGHAAAAAEAPLASGVAAIRGEIPDVSGSAFGVLGISHSLSGAGVVARNESTGADLVLDGSAQGEPDTLLTQSGLDRPSASGATFNFQNSGAGALSLQVDGVAVDTANTAIAWARLAGVPAGFADGVDNDTTYTAGNQLALVGTQFNVLEGPGSGLEADTVDGLHAAALQARVTGVCPEGESVRGVNPDGTVVCYEVPVPPKITTVDDPANNVGSYISLAIGTDGFPVIGYCDATAGALKVAKCNDAACTGGDETINTVDDPANQVGQYTSIAIGTDGFPVIAYLDSTAYALKVAKCNDAACAGHNETITTVDDPGNWVGYETSIAIGTDGFPVISYQDYSAGALKVAKCNNASCTLTTITTVDDPANTVGYYTSIAIGTDGFPVISYLDGTAGALKVAKCNDPACAGGGETITTVDDPANNVGGYSSIAIGADGFPVISYYDSSANALKVAKCNDPACAGHDETITTVNDPANAVGYYTSIAIGADGFPVISYWDIAAGALKVAKCNDAACAGGDETITTVDDPANSVGSRTSLALGADGFPVIAYFDGTAGALKVAKCMNPSCRY